MREFSLIRPHDFWFSSPAAAFYKHNHDRSIEMNKELLRQVRDVLILNNMEWKELADSGDAGNWKAEDQPHYAQTQAVIKAVCTAISQPVKVLAPNFRGYALLGTGQYLINHTPTDADPELVISIATDKEKEGRVIGDERENESDALIHPDVMAVRIGFTCVEGLDALESQLKYLRKIHFTESTEQPDSQFLRGA